MRDAAANGVVKIAAGLKGIERCSRAAVAVSTYHMNDKARA